MQKCRLNDATTVLGIVIVYIIPQQYCGGLELHERQLQAKEFIVKVDVTAEAYHSIHTASEDFQRTSGEWKLIEGQSLETR